MSYELTTSVQLGPNYASSNLAATLINVSGEIISSQSGINSYFYNKGGGFYQWTYSSFPSDFRGSILIHESGIQPTGTNILTMFALNPQDYEYVDAKISSISSIAVGAYQIIGVTKDQSGGLLGGSTVEIYPSGNGAILEKSVSNMSTARSVFNLDSGDYRAYVYNPTVAYWNNPFYFTVSSDTTMDFTGTTLSVQPPSSASAIRIYGYVYDLGLDQLDGVEMILLPSGLPAVVNNVVISERPIVGISDSTGYVYTDVINNGSGLPLRVKVPKAHIDVYFIAPASGQLNIASLL